MIYRHEQLGRGLKRFHIVFLKPEIGGQGEGIIKIGRLSSGFLIQTGTHRSRFVKNRKKVVLSIHQAIGNKPYILQKGIDLLTVNGRPVDFRVFLLKQGKQWQTMGVIGKWAQKNKIVTTTPREVKLFPLRKH